MAISNTTKPDPEVLKKRLGKRYDPRLRYALRVDPNQCAKKVVNLSSGQAARMAGVTIQGIRYWMKHYKDFPATWTGTRYSIPSDQFEEWVNMHCRIKRGVCLR